MQEKTITLDWESGHWDVYNGRTVKQVGKNDLFSYLESLSPHTVIVEGAHIRPRGPLSVAQVYTEDELLMLEKAALVAGHTILAFPEILTFRARQETRIDDKADDSKALFRFVKKHPEITIQQWRIATPEDVRRWEYLNAIRNDCTVRLNVMRPRYESPEVDRVTNWLERNHDKLSQPTRDLFKITYKRKLKFNKTSVMSIYVNCFNEDGTLRTNPRGQFIGRRTIWAVLKLHPYHRRAGTARSNLMYHLLRNLEKGIAPEDRQAIRANFRHGIKELISAFRDFE